MIGAGPSSLPHQISYKKTNNRQYYPPFSAFEALKAFVLEYDGVAMAPGRSTRSRPSNPTNEPPRQSPRTPRRRVNWEDQQGAESSAQAQANRKEKGYTGRKQGGRNGGGRAPPPNPIRKRWGPDDVE